MLSTEIAGQLNTAERHLLQDAILRGEKKPEVVLEIGTWLGGGSTLHILRALEQNGQGHLWGIEADRSIYDRMLANIASALPSATQRFTPLFGLSHEVLPKWLAAHGADFLIDLVFLDGGDNPMEQVTEFKFLDNRIPVGGQLLAHDAKLRKGRWLGPYLSVLDHWTMTLHDISDEGLLAAHKVRAQPSPESYERAEAILRQLRLNFFEMVGALLPSKANAFLLRFLPTQLIKKITQGRS